ncbi:MAG TPA: TetR/AcrR family transcriptional regulator [Pyrinomonadaceae bacterium]|nr:TetR/AcrR family transcriptional regulator [Pyrinomonadaceae bacterium]
MKDATQVRDVRSAILDAADRLLARNGYKKMTIDDLAAEVGIGKGSVYLHFTSKEEIALSHIDAIIERVKARLDQVAQKKTSYESRLKEMLIERVTCRFDSVQHYTQSLNDILSKIRPSLLERRKRYFDEEARIFAALIKDGIADGSFAKVNVSETARSLLLATNSLLPYSLSTQELGERKEIEKRASALADLLLKGLKAR